MTATLTVAGLTAGYGDTTILDDVSLTIAQGECVSIIGRNGVGKSTLLETLSGHTTVKSGQIVLDGQQVTAMPANRRVRLGLGYVPQEREIFPSLTVLENLTVCARPGKWGLEQVLELFPSLRTRLVNMGNQLSGGEQQMLSVARALMTNPRLLMMDEPSEGLAPVVVDQLFDAMSLLRDDDDMSILLVEQKVDRALQFSARSIVMDRGRILFDGPSARLDEDSHFLESLIGVGRRA
jgi:branched-chain amino acid transport system ATP-binding protein